MINNTRQTKELFDEDIMDMYYHFAIDDMDMFDKKTKGNSIIKRIVTQHSAWKTNGADLREEIVSRVLGWKHNISINGFDAITLDERDGEIKTESLRGDGLYLSNIDEWIAERKEAGKKLSYKMCGRTRWSNCTTDKSRNPKYKNKLELLVGENPRMALAGFVDGKLVYVITFDFNDCPNFPKRLKTKTPTTTSGDWKDASSLKLEFINIDFVNSKFMESGLYNQLKGLITRGIKNER